MSDSIIDFDLTLNSNNTSENKSHVYLIDGKVWRIGEQKISKWSKAKCNKIIKDNGNDNQPIDPQSTFTKDNVSN
jgi:hypothetical protein